VNFQKTKLKKVDYVLIVNYAKEHIHRKTKKEYMNIIKYIINYIENKIKKQYLKSVKNIDKQIILKYQIEILVTKEELLEKQEM
jgi:hypothetical protein